MGNQVKPVRCLLAGIGHSWLHCIGHALLPNAPCRTLGEARIRNPEIIFKVALEWGNSGTQYLLSWVHIKLKHCNGIKVATLVSDYRQNLLLTLLLSIETKVSKILVPTHYWLTERWTSYLVSYKVTTMSRSSLNTKVLESSSRSRSWLTFK